MTFTALWGIWFNVEDVLKIVEELLLKSACFSGPSAVPGLKLCNLLWGVLVLDVQEGLGPHCTTRTTSGCRSPHCAIRSTLRCLSPGCAGGSWSSLCNQNNLRVSSLCKMPASKCLFITMLINLTSDHNRCIVNNQLYLHRTPVIQYSSNLTINYN